MTDIEKCIAKLEKEKASLVLEVHNKAKRIAELKAEVDQAVENRDYWKWQAIVLKAKEREMIDKAKIAYCSACATGLANSKICRECPCVELGKFTQLLKEE